METKYFVILAIFIIFAILGLVVLKPKKEKAEPTMDYELVMAILQITIKRVIDEKNDDYVLRTVKVPYDYQQEVTSMTQTVMESLSSHVLNELEFYHPRKYIIQKVQKDMQAFLIGYMRTNKPNMSAGSLTGR